MSPRRRSLCILGVALAVGVLVGPGCGSEEPAVDLTCGGVAPYAARGPWGVGVTTLTLKHFSHPPRYPAAIVCT